MGRLDAVRRRRTTTTTTSGLILRNESIPWIHPATTTTIRVLVQRPVLCWTCKSELGNEVGVLVCTASPPPHRTRRRRRKNHHHINHHLPDEEKNLARRVIIILVIAILLLLQKMKREDAYDVNASLDIDERGFKNPEPCQ